MKKLIYAGAFLLLGTVALSSCKKDWTCRCGDGEFDTTTIKNQTKKKAKDICQGKVGIGLVSVKSNDCYIE